MHEPLVSMHETKLLTKLVLLPCCRPHATIASSSSLSLLPPHKRRVPNKGIDS